MSSYPRKSIRWSAVGNLGRWSGISTIQPNETPQAAVVRALEHQSGCTVLRAQANQFTVKLLDGSTEMLLRVAMGKPQPIAIPSYLMVVLALVAACAPLAEHIEISDAGADAAMVVDAGSQMIDSGYPSQTCWCCVWAPGTSYPNGDVVCLEGASQGPTCLAQRSPTTDAPYPDWVPQSVSCASDNPWGDPSKAN